MVSALLKSQISVVTGGASGIGKAICQKLAENGSRLIVADIHEETAINTAKSLTGSGHVGIKVDVSNIDSVKKIQNILKKIDTPPSVLVNCAGITMDSTLLKMTPEKWKKVVDVNLNGVFYISQIIAKNAVENKTPLSIINISSIVGKVGNFGQTNYAATKSGVIGFTKSAARELADKNIRVNAVLPGFIKTSMTSSMPPQVLDSMLSLVPQKRLGEPEEVANAVLFLASDMSSFITGTTLEVTGGLGM